MLTGEVRAGAIWCKSWFCEHCAPIRKRQLQAQAANGKPNRFITLTSKYRPETMTPDEAAQQLVHAWRMVVQKGKRDKIFDDIQYIAVFEETKRGWPHLHILARCSWVAQDWLSYHMEKYANSPIVDVRKVKSRKRAAWYISKYTAKAPHRFNGCKRYWRTHGYDPTPGKADKPLHDHFQGYWSDWNVDEISGVYEAHDYDLEWTSAHSFIATPRSFDLHATKRANWQGNHDPPQPEQPQCESSSKTKPSTSTALTP